MNNLECTKSTIDDNGWLHSGDIAYFDEEGYLYVIDRLKETIKYKGFQVDLSMSSIGVLAYFLRSETCYAASGILYFIMNIDLTCSSLINIFSVLQRLSSIREFTKRTDACIFNSVILLKFFVEIDGWILFRCINLQIAPADLESVLVSHPDIIDAAVIG